MSERASVYSTEGQLRWSARHNLVIRPDGESFECADSVSAFAIAAYANRTQPASNRNELFVRAYLAAMQGEWSRRKMSYDWQSWWDSWLFWWRGGNIHNFHLDHAQYYFWAAQNAVNDFERFSSSEKARNP